MKEPVWIREIEALALHAKQIALFGGPEGIRDLTLLESALARPRNLFAYSETPVTLANFAAAYGFGIAANHPFVDGNKRTAMHVAFLSLEFNGVPVIASQEEAYLMFQNLAAGKVKESQLAEWFKRNTAPTTG